MPAFDAHDYISHPADYNTAIPENVDVIAGDPLLELQSNAISTLSSTQLPGTNSWLAVIDWLRDLIDTVSGEYDAIFIEMLNSSSGDYSPVRGLLTRCDGSQ